ncbi:MAG: OmpA family protein [Gemmatimonadota bacterium]
MRIPYAITCAAVLLTGCGYAKKTDMQAELARLRQDMQAADEQNAARIGETAAAQQRLAARLSALEGGLQELRKEFDVKITKLEGMVAVHAPVYFDFAASDVRETDRAVLDRFAAIVKQTTPGAVVTVEGFTDPAGSKSYNLRLGKARADAVRSYLVSSGGLDPDHVRSVSYGETQPRQIHKGAAGSKTGAQANRRVTLVVDYATSAAERAVAAETR